jgi:hypothetical protein
MVPPFDGEAPATNASFAHFSCFRIETSSTRIYSGMVGEPLPGCR